MNVVLYAPEQPGNVGTIGRSCVCTGTALHLIEPIGFHITDRHIKRAGLDYWPRLTLYRHMNYETFLKEGYEKALQDCGPESGTPPQLWYVTTKATKTYADVSYGPADFLMFGRESAGIPEEILARDKAHCVRIPMAEGERSLNLSNSVSIVLYEALRQCHFPALVREGSLHTRSWEEDPS